MPKNIEKILVLIADFIFINLASIIYFLFRVETGWFEIFSNIEFILPVALLYIYWTVIFFFVGMYRTWFASSRFDELSALFKSTFVGIFLVFFVILWDDFQTGTESSLRFLIFVYWGIFILSVGFGRLVIRSIQKNLLLNGIGRRNALILGFNEKAFKMHDTIARHKALGRDIVGYVSVKDENVGKEYKGVKVLGGYKEIQDIIDSTDAKDVIIALEKHEEDVMFAIMALTDTKSVGLKIVPDLYEIISGQAKTTQIYGFPLIDIMPELMPEWEKRAKRVFDLIISIIFLIFASPIILITSIAIKIDSKGPVFYKQERSGLNGKPFYIYKFRSMNADAEKKSGPMWSTKNDPRITKVGAFIRKVRIDEIPQMLNILKGEMSMVGPRPERPIFVEQLAQDIPLYKRRLKVRPGLTGWAQVKHKYDETVEDVKTKLRYDLFYIENMSIRMDIKIMLRTVLVVLFGKGHYE